MQEEYRRRYSLEEVRESTLEYFSGDELPTDVWIKKYALRDGNGDFVEKNPDEMHKRLAKEFARIEQKYKNPLSEEVIYKALKDFNYIVPQGSPMYGIGNNFSITSLSNCFVVGSNDQADSYGSIMRTDEEQVQLMKRRGGVGHDISHLRPGGAKANNTTLEGLAGATLYMERYSNSTREVAQGGRRGALMLSISIKHPDAERFIDAKLETGKVTGANISVKVDDEFMEAVKNDSDYWQTFPVDYDISGYTARENHKYGEMEEHGFHNPDGSLDTVYIRRIKAKKLWDKIIKNAWQSAEPGVLFWDTVTKESPAAPYGPDWKEVSTNPCGEIPLNPYDSCRLIAINLFSYVNHAFTPAAHFNFELFKEHVRIAQRIMDDLVDLEIEKIDAQLKKIESDPESDEIKKVERELWLKIRQRAVDARRTGLGVTAEGDMLAAMGLRYGSEEAITYSSSIHRYMAIESYKTSIELARERGAFPMWDFNKERRSSSFVDRIYEQLEPKYRLWWETTGRRNIANLTIAPTGTVSIMTRTTSGIEPLFMPYYQRRTKVEDLKKATFIDEVGDGWVTYNVFHPKYLDWYANTVQYEHPPEKAKELLMKETDEEVLRNLFERSPWYRATANDIDWSASVRMQGAIQKWVDHSISKTVNIPKQVTVEEVGEIYKTAHEAGCKGCTIYRDGSRSGVLISKEESSTDKFEYSKAYKRPKTTQCDIYHKTALKQDWTVLVGKVNGNPYEIFVLRRLDNKEFPLKIETGKITKIKSKTYKLEGVYNGKHYEIPNIVSLMSEDERVNTRKYSSLLRHGMHPEFIDQQIDEFATVVSFDKVVQRVLRNYIEDPEETVKCPECGSEHYHSNDGCWECPDCGYAKCG